MKVACSEIMVPIRYEFSIVLMEKAVTKLKFARDTDMVTKLQFEVGARNSMTVWYRLSTSMTVPM